MNIQVLDINNLEILGFIHDYESFSLTNNYNSAGDFVLSINNSLSNSKLFIKDRIIMLDGNGYVSGIITHVSIEVEEDGNEIRTVKGKTLGHLLSYRITNAYNKLDFNIEYGNAETVMKNYIDKNIVNATDTKRNIDNLIISDDTKLGDYIKWQSKFDSLLDVITDISTISSLGWNISINTNFNCFEFEVYEGRDLSEEVIFSTDYGNLNSLNYTYDEYNMKNFAFVAGEIYDNSVTLDEEGNIITETEEIINATTGEKMVVEKQKERRLYQVGDNESTGVNRKEVFIEVSETKDEYVDIPELGLRELETMNSVESIDSKIIDNTLFTYGVDYNLGDLVTVYHEDWGIGKTLRISSVTINIENNKDIEVEISFGDVLPLLNDKMKSQFKSIKPYTKK